MLNDLFTFVILACGFVVGRSAYINILEMDRYTRHSIRVSYILICLGVIVLFVSMLPALKVFLMGGIASVLTGACGLVLFSKRKLLEPTKQDKAPEMREDRAEAVERRVV